MKIKGVAVKFNKIMVCLPKPNRHCDCFRYAKEILELDRKTCVTGGVASNQGFYTEEGIFLDRLEAFKVAEENKQIILYDSKKGCLFSENLW